MREHQKQGIKVSTGSVSNFINEHKRQHKKASQPQSSTSVDSISTGIPLNKDAGSPLLSGIGKAAIPTNIPIDTPRSVNVDSVNASAILISSLMLALSIKTK